MAENQQFTAQQSTQQDTAPQSTQQDTARQAALKDTAPEKDIAQEAALKDTAPEKDIAQEAALKDILQELTLKDTAPEKDVPQESIQQDAAPSFQKPPPDEAVEAKETAVENLIDGLGAEPSAAAALATTGDLDPADLLADTKLDLLVGDQGEAGGLPGKVDLVDAGGFNPGDGSVQGPAFDAKDNHLLGNASTDPSLDREFEEWLESKQGVGGLDGRNPLDDGGGGSGATGSPIGGNPYSGVGREAAGVLPAHEQAVLDVFKQQTNAAAAAGDSGRVDDLNKQTEGFLKDIGQFAGAGTDNGDEMAVSGMAPVMHNADEGVVVDAATKDKAGDNEGGLLERASKAFSSSTAKGPTKTQMDKALETIDETGRGTTEKTDEKADNETPPDETPEDAAKDYEFDYGAGAPDLHKEFTDAYFDHKFEADRGADVDPNPNDDGGGSFGGDLPTASAESLAAQYEQGYVPVTDEDLEAAEARLDTVPDEEFLEL